MTIQDVFQALGGGLVGLLGVAVVVLATFIVRLYETRLREHKDTIATLNQQIKDLTSAINRQSDAIESWTPTEQRRRLRAP